MLKKLSAKEFILLTGAKPSSHTMVYCMDLGNLYMTTFRKLPTNNEKQNVTINNKVGDCSSE